MKPGELLFEDLRHVGEIIDLTGRPPRMKREEAPVAVRADDGEAAEGWQIGPAARIDLAVDRTTVGRDHQWDGGIAAWAVAIGELYVCISQVSVVGRVGDRQDTRRPCLQQCLLRGLGVSGRA